MPQLKLTDTAIERLPTPVGATDWYLDPDLHGFQLAVGARTRTFYAIKALRGRNVRKKLGQWPMVRAREARDLAMSALGDISKGIDPRPKKTRTLSEALADYVDVYSHSSHARLSNATSEQYRKCLELHCSAWLNRDMGTITQAEVAKLQWKLRERKYMANQCLRVLRMMYRHAIDTLAVEMPDPTRGVRFYPESKRETKIIDWAVWYRAVSELPTVRRHYYLLAALTGIRRSNLCELSWNRVDLQNRTLKLIRTKNGTSPSLPLSRYACELLCELRHLHHQWVFPANSAAGHIVEPKEKSVPGRIHDLRRMFTTAAGQCHLPEYVIARLRGDIAQQTVIQGYMGNVADHDATEKISEHLKRLWTRAASTHIVSFEPAPA